MRWFNKVFPYVLPILFFAIALLTLYDYGMNWDSPQHFAKGQAFFRFLTTGKENYNGLPKFCTDKNYINSSKDYKTGEICNRFRKQRISEYESSILDFKWALGNVYGHPPFGDEMLALFNQVFFVNLGWVEDVQAYHLYSLVMVFILALFVAFWLKKTYGTFAAIIGVLSLYLYPLLLGEQHFNIKDPPLAAWFIIAIGLFYFAVRKRNPWLMILSAIAGGFSFSTKINYIFAPIILLPWLIFYIFAPIKKIIRKYGFTLKFIQQLYIQSPKGLIISFLFYPIIIALIFFGTLPSFWFDPSGTLGQLIKFYTDVGVSSCQYARFTPGWFLTCTSNYAPLFFLYSTPIITLFYLFIGIGVGIKNFKKFGYLPILLLSFFLVTILRVTLSIAAIYGGIRQIMEFIGPLSMLCAIGAVALRSMLVRLINKIKIIKKNVNQKIIVYAVSILLILGFFPISIKMIEMHPNENIYMNALIGGVKGAVAQNIPGAGNTYGNTYAQGVKWINNHAQKNGILILLFGLGQNISRSTLRPDIWFYKGGLPLSGYHQKGEYVISLATQETSFKNTFRYKFFVNFLNPVYTVNADGIRLLTVWQNSPKFNKNNINLTQEEQENINIENKDKEVTITLPNVERLKRLEINYPQFSCDKSFIGSTVIYSQDGKNFITDQDAPDDFTQDEVSDYSGDRVYLFAADKAKIIKIQVPDTYPCNLSANNYKLFVF
ncbi:MAG TPA: glycosyltransferase family 39 protein [Patescibacteria group bacterium]